MRQRSIGIGLARVIGVLTALAVGTLAALLIRTQSCGTSVPILYGEMIFAAVAALPLAALAWPAWRCRYRVVALLYFPFVCLFLSEALAFAEEVAFRRAVLQQVPAGRVVRARLWPFHHHHLLYDPATGLFHGGD